MCDSIIKVLLQSSFSRIILAYHLIIFQPMKTLELKYKISLRAINSNYLLRQTYLSKIESFDGNFASSFFTVTLSFSGFSDANFFPRKKTATCKRRRLDKADQSKHRLSALTVAELLVDRIIKVLRCVRIRTGAAADEHPSSAVLDVQHLP